MGYIPVNLLEVNAAGDFELFPQGLYQLQIAGVKQDTSKEGNPVVRVAFTILNGPDGATAHAGKNLPRTYPLSEKARGFIKRLMLACGIAPQEIAATGGQLTEEMLVGRCLSARVSESNFGEKKSNEVAEIIPETMKQYEKAQIQAAPGAAGMPMQQLPAPQQQWGAQPAPQPMPQQPQQQWQQPMPQQQWQQPMPQQPWGVPAQPQPMQQAAPIQGPGAYTPPPTQVPPMAQTAPGMAPPVTPGPQQFVPPAAPPGAWPGFGGAPGQQYPAPPVPVLPK